VTPRTAQPRKVVSTIDIEPLRFWKTVAYVTT
jgi:hypothetical protein